MRILIYAVLLLMAFAISGLFLFWYTQEERTKSEKEERRIGNHGLLLYTLFFWGITAVLLFFVFLIGRFFLFCGHISEDLLFWLY